MHVPFFRTDGPDDQSGEESYRLEFRDIVEIAQHEWSRDWAWIDASWTDEYLCMLLDAYSTRHQREQALLAAAYGFSVSVPFRNAPGSQRALLERLGGEVEEVD
jgi:hypothetical protein